MDPAELLELANNTLAEAQRRGLTGSELAQARQGINEFIRTESGGRFDNITRLQESIRPTSTPTGGAPLGGLALEPGGLPQPQATPLGAQDAAVEQALLRTNERGGASQSSLGINLPALGRGRGRAAPDIGFTPAGLGDFTASAIQGATLGGADEIAGLAGEDAQAAVRQATADRRLLSPTASLLSEIAGGILIPAFGAEALATRFGGGLLGSVAAGGITGAVTGAAVGGLEAEGPINERIAGAGQGAVIGGATGVVGGPLFSALLGLPAGSVRLADRISGRVNITDPALRTSGATLRIQREAAEQLNAKLSRAGVSARGRALKQAVNDLGPDATVADLSAPLKQELRQAITEAPGLSATAVDAAGARSAASSVTEDIATRSRGRGRRFADDLRAGVPEDIRSTDFELMRNNAISNRKSVGQEVFGPLEREFTDIRDPELMNLLFNNPVIRGIAESSGLTFKKAANGTETLAGPLTFRKAQQIRQLLAKTHSANKSLAFDGEQAFANLGVWDVALDNAIPPQGSRLGYRQANERTFLASRGVEVLEEGRKAARKTAADARLDRIAAIDGIRDPQAAVVADRSFRAGMLNDFENKLLDTPKGGGTARQLQELPEGMQAKLGMLGTPDEPFRLAPLNRRRVIEQGFTETSTVATAGSKTDRNQAAARQSAIRDVGQGLGLGQGKLGVFRTIMSRLPGRLTDTELREAAFLVGRALATDGVEAAETLAFNITQRSVRVSQASGILGAAAARAAETKEDRPFSAGRGGLLRIQSPGRR